jgi:hypothetical protein
MVRIGDDCHAAKEHHHSYYGFLRQNSFRPGGCKYHPPYSRKLIGTSGQPVLQSLLERDSQTVQDLINMQ